MVTTQRILSASTLTGNKVVNGRGENLGDIKDLMVDTSTGKVEYAVLSFGGFLGMGDKLFAVPMTAMRLDKADKTFVLDVSKKHLEKAPGFDKDKWPDFASPQFRESHIAHWTATTSA